MANNPNPNAPLLRQLKLLAGNDPAWKEVWIVAGGKSARSFDFDRLRGCTVLAVNDAVHLYPEAYALFSADGPWIQRHREFIQTQFSGQPYLAVPRDRMAEYRGLTGACFFDWRHESGLSEDPAALCTGGNSGYAAINLAYLQGAQLIHLIGYDMNPREDEKFEQWAPRFRSMLPQLKARDVTVLNHNPDSFIDAFPKVFGMGAPA